MASEEMQVDAAAPPGAQTEEQEQKPEMAVDGEAAPDASTSTSETTTAAVVADAKSEGEEVDANGEAVKQEDPTTTATEDEEQQQQQQPNGEEEQPQIPPAPTRPPLVIGVETVYINNLNEKIANKVMKETLKNLFRQYGTVLDIVAHGNLRMRGQAFVAMSDREAASRAVKELKGFPLYGKPMNVNFAKTPSDAVVKRKTPDLLDVHLEERKLRKRISRQRNPLRKKAAAKRYAEKTGAVSGTTAPAEGAAPAKAAAAGIAPVPDEYLPPNKILFIQNLPDTTTKEDLEALFKVHPNLHDVRLIPGRKGIAFVEYMDEASSIVAKEALHGHSIDDTHEIKVTFAKQ